jgi:glycosyltransferase involved in cell wall biosynthesis
VKRLIRDLIFKTLGLDPEAVVVVLRSGNHELAEEMVRCMRGLVPDRRVIDFPLQQGSGIDIALDLSRRLRGFRVALAAVLFDGSLEGAAMRRAAWLIAPGRILAFNSRLERQHIRLTEWVASWLFLRGVPRDRIFLRPRWLAPFKSDRTVLPTCWSERGGRGFRPNFARVAVVSPYLPFPRAHGGAVRLEGLLREAARDADIVFFGFEDGQSEDDYNAVSAFCARVYSAAKPRYREPRWSTLLPPEACEFWNQDLDDALRREMAACGCSLLQGEYTQMARYRPDILVEHDVTEDLMRQVLDSSPSFAAWWDWRRWRSFERGALCRTWRVVFMSDKDRALAPYARAAVIPNGVDLDRFRPCPQTSSRGVLFVGSFRHFPNVRAWRFFLEEIWPALDGIEGLRASVVAGPDPELYWPGSVPDPRITLHGYVADVRPLYEAAAVVVIPTLESAGTNLKALEAAAMGRAMVSTPSGVAGLGFVPGESVWLATGAAGFAAGVRALLCDPQSRARQAAAARAHVERNFGWEPLARRQVELWRELLS